MKTQYHYGMASLLCSAAVLAAPNDQGGGANKARNDKADKANPAGGAAAKANAANVPDASSVAGPALPPRKAGKPKKAADAPQYRALKRSFLNGVTYEEGSEINDYYDLPGVHLMPLNAAARAKFDEARQTQQAQRASYASRKLADAQHKALYGEDPAPEVALTGTEITAMRRIEELQAQPAEPEVDEDEDEDDV